MRKFPVPAALLLLVGAPAALADSWLPFADQRVGSPSGKHYAIVRAEGGGTLYELVRRREGAGPIEPAEDRFKKHGIARDEEDRLLEAGSLPQRPLRIRVLDDPAGLVLFERYGNVGYGDSLVVKLPGKPVVRLALADIVGEDAANRYRTENATVSSIWWFAGFLVDEENRKVLVVTADHDLVSVSYSGEVSKASKEDLLRHLRTGTAEDRAFALEVAAAISPEGLGAEALALAMDAAQPTGIRMRAAVAAKRAGEKAPLEALFLTSVEKGGEPDVRSYAASHLGEMIGVAAIPVLRRLMRGPADDDVWNPAKESFAFLGEAAVPTLAEMLGEARESADYRGGAAHVLGELGKKALPAAPALYEAVLAKDDYVANAAVNAVIAIAPPDLTERLTELLEKGSTQDARIAGYFESHPVESARAALEAALKRAPPDSYDSRRIQAALAALD